MFKPDHIVTLLSAALLLGALPSCVSGDEAALESRPPVLIVGEVPMLDGVLNVLVSEELASVIETIGPESARQMFGVSSIERAFPDAGEFEAKHRRAGLHLWYTLRFDKTRSLTRAMGEIAALDGVASVEGVPRIRNEASSNLPFNDYFASYQWNYYNDGSLYEGFVSGADINVKDVWSRYTTGSGDVIVAVFDGGVDLSHPDLTRIAIAAGEGGSCNFCDKRSAENPYRIIPEEHGTHVASIIAAQNNNREGICGIAGGSGNGGVRIMSVQIMDEDDYASSENLHRAFVYAADNGALVANNSWGFDFDENGDGVLDEVEYETAKSFKMPELEKAAMDYFIDNAGTDADGVQTGLMKGGLVVFAAGNENVDIGKPADYERVIAVGGFGPDLKRAYYSNYGDWVDICAPGGSDGFGDYGWIVGCGVSGVDRDYVGMIGTSMACPHVSGVAALLISHFGGPGYTLEDLKSQLLGGADTSVEDAFDHHIGPKLDALGAFTFGGDHAPVLLAQIPDTMFGGIGETLEMDMSEFFSDPDKDALDYKLVFDKAIATAVADKNLLTLTCLEYGSSRVEVTATDKDGYECSTSFNLITRRMDQGFDLYPNPVGDVLHVRPGTYESQKYGLSIMDPSGREVGSWQLSGDVFSEQSFDMSGCAPGVYAVKIYHATLGGEYLIVKK